MSLAEQTAYRVYNEYKLGSLSNDVKKQLIILFLKGNAFSSSNHISEHSDSELEALLADCPNLHEDNISDISDEDYKSMVRNMHNKPQRNIERWL